jgi:hypothetical protein
VSGLWDQPGVPHKGWTAVDVEDLGPDEDDRAICQMCRKEQIRYVHHMTHQGYGDLAVGCICAGKMTGDYVGAKERERVVRNLGKRRENWLKRKWRISGKGNQYLNILGHNVGVNRQGQGWVGRVDGWFSQRVPTEAAAKLKAFEKLVEMGVL